MLLTAPATAQPEPANPPAAPDAAGEGTEAAPAEPPAEAAAPTATDTAAAADTAALARIEQRLQQQDQQLAAQEARLQELQTANENAALTAEAALDQASASAEEAALERQRFRIYGFTDIGFSRTWIHKGASWNNIMPDSASFLLGNLNLYFDANPLPGFRALTEIRFTMYPHGSEFGDFERYDNTVWDENAPTGRNQVIWGGVILERAWLEWNEYDALQVRAGYFLTPYGIWNVDHGTPTLIALMMPDFWASEYFPTHQLGVQLHGATFTGAWQLGYHATVSNGRTPGQHDLTDDKALGGRLFASYEGDTRVKVGASGYWGTYSEQEKTLAGVNPLRVTAEEIVAYEEYALGADLSLDIGALRFRTEAAMQRLAYDEGKREEYGPGAYHPDFYTYDIYGLVAYQLPWLGLEPYVFAEHREADNNDMAMYSGGLNVRFNAAAQLKTQYAWINMIDRPSHDNFHAFDTRFVVAF